LIRDERPRIFGYRRSGASDVGLLAVVAVLSALARLSVLYPIVLVVGGALLGFVPGLPEVRLDADFVLVVRSIRGYC
jgi:hypothetical protein